LENRNGLGGERTTPGAAEMEAAVVANEGLVHWAVHRQYLGRLSYQDAVQEGRIALWRALRHYRPDQGKLFRYALVAIRHGIWDAVARAEREAHERLGGAVLAAEPDLATALDQATDRVLVRALVGQLPAPWRQVIEWRYGLDGQGEQRFAEIGQTLGVTKQRAQQLHVEALLALADPATSTILRRHVGRNEVSDYRAYLARRRAWQRRRRGRP
jgi:RNA polymerase sigma factor (sigma-70 family)